MLKLKKEIKEKKLVYSTEDLFVKAININGRLYISNDRGFTFRASRTDIIDIKSFCSFFNSHHALDQKISILVGSTKSGLNLKARGVLINNNKITIDIADNAWYR